jgi:uncharacterized membrane protein YsdA (DUF1294 family)
MSALALLLIIAAAAINLAAFTAMAVDKQAAIDDRRRIPERTLLQLALIGGAAGAVAAQQMLRHKTRKEPFRTLLWGIGVVQVVLVWAWAVLVR